MIHAAVRNLYPNVISIIDISPNVVEAYDANNVRVELDEVLVMTELNRLLTEKASREYIIQRKREYPPIEDYIDGIVKGDQAQIDEYIAKCLSVKEKYPKP